MSDPTWSSQRFPLMKMFWERHDSKLHSNAFWIRPHTHDVPTVCHQSLTWWWDRHLPLSFPAPPLFPLVTGVNIFRLRPSQPLCVCVCVCMCVPSSVSSGWMSVPVGSIGALIAFFPSSWRSLTRKTSTHTQITIKKTSKSLCHLLFCKCKLTCIYNLWV